MLSIRDPLYIQIHNLIVKGWEKKFHGTNKQKSAQVATVISNKIDFNSKKDTRDKKYIIF